MFSFHKTLFPYLQPARDYQAKQASSSTPGFPGTCTCISVFFKNAMPATYTEGISGWVGGWEVWG